MTSLPEKKIVTVVVATRSPFGKSTPPFARAAPLTTMTTEFQNPEFQNPKIPKSEIQNKQSSKSKPQNPRSRIQNQNSKSPNQTSKITGMT